jgi:RNA polymerase sigma-70 factor (ECF subfamily)
MRSRDPLADPEPLIERVYAYAAYRIGAGPEAEDVTSETFERALRYRRRYDARRGEPLAWLLGIARRCVADSLATRRREPPTVDDELQRLADGAGSRSLEDDAVRRVTLLAALDDIEDRDRELIALRYGADLTARQIAAIMELKTNAVEVALHRAVERLRRRVTEDRALESERGQRNHAQAARPDGPGRGKPRSGRKGLGRSGGIRS